MKQFLLGLLKALGVLSVLAGAGLFLMYQCSKAVVETIDEVQDVDNYDVFIDDAVRFTLASADPKFVYVDLENTELQSKADSKIESLASNVDEDKPSYKIALTELSKTGNSYERKYAADLLEIYNNLKIELTPYEKDTENSGNVYFQEKNSRVHFTASLGILCYCSGDTWDISRYTEYLETGYFKSAPSEELEYDEEIDEAIDIDESLIDNVDATMSEIN